MYQTNMVAGWLNTKQSTAKTASTRPVETHADWYRSLANAWGKALDGQAQKLVDTANSINDSSSVGDALMVSAQAHQLSFMSNAASTTSNSVGQALETLAKKQ